MPSPTSETHPPLHALQDTLPALLRAITERRRVALPERNTHFVESGIIVAAIGPHAIGGRRIDYPQLMGLLELDHSIGDMVVQKRWERTVELGRFRALLTPNWTFAYAPGCEEPRLTMVPRRTTAGALPTHSVGAEHPEALERAWNLLQARWGQDIIRRDRCGELARQP